MSRMIKEKIVAKYGAKFRDMADVAVISTQGLDVQRLTAFRSTLRAKGIRAMTLHNRLGKRALEGTGLAGLSTLLRGPSTIIWGGEGIVDIAKVLAGQAKSLAKMEIRGGISDGQVLSKADLETLSRMPSRQELIGQVVGRAIGMAARVAGLVKSAGGRLAAQVREVEKKAAEAAPAAEALADPKGVQHNMDKPPVAPGAPEAAPEVPAAGAAPPSDS